MNIVVSEHLFALLYLLFSEIKLKVLNISRGESSLASEWEAEICDSGILKNTEYFVIFHWAL